LIESKKDFKEVDWLLLMLMVRKFPSKKALATSIPFKRSASRDTVSNEKNELYDGTTSLYAATA